jgi:prophage antirepressor-like protein
MELTKYFENNKITVLGTFDNPLFIGKEIAEILEYSDTKKAIKEHVEEDDKQCFDDFNKTVKGGENYPLAKLHPQTILINECGLNSLIYSSNKPIAKTFRKWVFAEVIPSIRKTGQYKIPEKKQFIKQNKTLHINDENDLHHAVVQHIRNYYDNDIQMKAGLGEMQMKKNIYDNKLASYKKGYQRGEPDLIIDEMNKDYNGLVIEFKTPQGKGVVDSEQIIKLTNAKRRNKKVIVSNDLLFVIKEIADYMQTRRIQCEYCKRKFKTEQKLLNHQIAIHKIKA